MMGVIEMRGKIAKKKRRELLNTGAVIIKEQFTGAKDAKRKDKGYCVSFNLNGVSVAVSGRDRLEVFKSCLESAENECFEEVQ